jgi:hypothetical protein
MSHDGDEAEMTAQTDSGQCLDRGDESNRQIGNGDLEKADGDVHVDLQTQNELIEGLASWSLLAPLMAAILGPLSILLGIPALTQGWY